MCTAQFSLFWCLKVVGELSQHFVYPLALTVPSLRGVFLVKRVGRGLKFGIAVYTFLERELDSFCKNGNFLSTIFCGPLVHFVDNERYSDRASKNDAYFAYQSALNARMGPMSPIPFRIIKYVGKGLGTAKAIARTFCDSR